ncbi:MAG: TRAP transporter small permease [Candidatus Ventricola sp.]
MKVLKRVDQVLNAIRIVGIVVIMALAIGICATNIVLRYLVRGVSTLRPFAWGNEVMQMCAVWIAFLAAGLGVKQGSHISLDSVVRKFLPDRFATILRKVTQLIVLVVLAILVYVGITTTIKMSRSSLQNLAVSMGWFYASIPVGCGYLFYDYLLIFIFGEYPFKKKKNEDPVSDDKSIGAF